ncbi:MAG TPA: type II toxin-antitoxin system HicA family toxin [Tepidisphaeraceae bacterium]|nr:type II toxin-antitoxin system HicA family toxin [Tepidisphaeraceae bacterium]
MSYNRRKVMAAYSRRGVRVVREGAGHTVLEAPDGRRTAVPRHNELARGTVRAITEQLGLDWQSVKKEL